MNTRWAVSELKNVNGVKRRYKVRQLDNSSSPVPKPKIHEHEVFPGMIEWVRQPDKTERVRDGIVDRRDACVLSVLVVTVISLVQSILEVI